MTLLRDLLRESTRPRTKKKLPAVPESRIAQVADRRQSDGNTLPPRFYQCPACGRQVNADDPHAIQIHHRHVLDSFRIFANRPRLEAAELRHAPETDGAAVQRHGFI
jgi:hypothetical protein